jgi:two-component system phosphate regulon sensor histidine kinase PhoR
VIFLRRNWAIILACLLIPLVALLAVLQLTWIRDMGERERVRLRQGLFLAGGNLVAAFQRELLLAPGALAPPPKPVAKALAPGAGHPGSFRASVVSGDWSFFDERWEAWRNYALDPSIVSEIHLIVVAGGSESRVATWKNGTFMKEPDRALGDTIVSRIPSTSDHGAPRALIRAEGEEWFYLPIPDEAGLWLLVRYDAESLSARLLPLLAEQYLGTMSDYRFRIVERGTGRTLWRSDAKVGDEGFGLPDLRLGMFRQDILRSARSALNAVTVQTGGSRQGRSDADSLLFVLRAGRNIIADRGSSSDSGLALDPHEADSLWALEAVHRGGSLASVVRASMFRSAAASSGILLLLMASLIILALANRRATRLAARQEEFVASVTHELKTPLAVIGSAADNLADGIVSAPEAAARYGGAIKGETKRLIAMIDKLLLYTRIGSGRAAGNEEVDIADLAREVIAEREVEFAELRLRVELALPSSPLMVRGDAESLRHAIANLVSNVLVHAAEGGYIGIFVKRERQPGRTGRGKKAAWRAVIRVDDKGPGIPRRERRTVFEAFYRGKRAQDRQEAGSGIGLNLARRVARAHGGIVALDSTEDFGSSFSIIFPCGSEMDDRDMDESEMDDRKVDTGEMDAMETSDARD